MLATYRDKVDRNDLDVLFFHHILQFFHGQMCIIRILFQEN